MTNINVIYDLFYVPTGKEEALTLTLTHCSDFVTGVAGFIVVSAESLWGWTAGCKYRTIMCDSRHLLPAFEGSFMFF